MKPTGPKPSGFFSDSDTGEQAARKHIRGSSLLLSGRFFALGGKFVAQLLVVRYLSTSDFGAWAYALSAIAFLGGFAHLSLDRSVSRFASIYHQRKDYGRFFGTILLVTATVLVTGLLFVVALYTFPEQFARLIDKEAQPLTLLLILIFLVPLEALDALFIAIFATFSHPRAVFFRRYVLAPVIQLSVVGLLIVRGAGVTFLAYGYLVGTLVGVVISAWMLMTLLRQEGLLQSFSLRGVVWPTRELFSFSVPLMSSDWLAALNQSAGTLVLGYFYGTEQVAMFRVVMPVAVLNQLVLQSFTLLYVPSASRLFARDDYPGINDLYWRTAAWVAVLSFPVFAFTFVAATPLTVLFFGERYESSGLILAVLAVGQYTQASLGFNSTTLKVIGKIRYVVVINILASLVSIALTLLLVPAFGALGAAFALSGTMVLHNLMKQVGLRMATGFSLMDRRYAGAYALILCGGGALLTLQLLGSQSAFLLFPAAALASVVVFAFTKNTLRIGEVFPELRRIPLLRPIVT